MVDRQTTGISDRNPFVGPRPFEENETDFFYGRDTETQILEGLVLARRASLFFAQSGAGKSSLLRAGLIPLLTRRVRFGHGRWTSIRQKMQVWPILTVGRGTPSNLNASIPNVFIFSALLGLLSDDDPNDIATLTLSEAITRRFEQSNAARPAVRTSRLIDEMQAEAANGVQNQPDEQKPDEPDDVPTLIIFDQFEELFTHHLDHWQDRRDFFEQVREALADHPDVHILFTMREDFIAELVPYANRLPEALRPRFRLERLKRDAALLAIKQPAAKGGRTFADNVAEDLVDNLRRIQTRQGSRGAEGQGSGGVGERAP